MHSDSQEGGPQNQDVEAQVAQRPHQRLDPIAVKDDPLGGGNDLGQRRDETGDLRVLRLEAPAVGGGAP